MRNLKDKDFKFPINVYWVTSRESSDCAWTAVLAPNSTAVKEHRARVARGDAAPETLRWISDLGDVNDRWLELFRQKKLDASQRGNKSRAGVAFPEAMSDDLIELWVHVRGARCSQPSEA